MLALMSADIQQGRVEWVDILKGVAIILVVLGHISYRCPHLKEFIYSFHMPLFFTLAGCAAHISMQRSRSIGVFIGKRAIGLMVPYVVWLLSSPLIFGYAEQWRNYNLQEAIHCILTGNVACWFLICLFTLQLYYALYTWTSKKVKAGWVCILIAGGIYVGSFLIHRRWGWMHGDAGYWDLQFLTSAYKNLPAFALGIAMMQQRRVLDAILHSRVIALLCIVMVVFGNCLARDFQLLSISQEITGVAATCILIRLVHDYQLPAGISRQASFIGKSTLIIYLLSGQCQPTDIPIIGGGNSVMTALALGVVSILICYVCILFEKVLSLSPLTALLFLGKVKRKEVGVVR